MYIIIVQWKLQFREGEREREREREREEKEEGERGRYFTHFLATTVEYGVSFLSPSM